jgi:lipoate---protein ligase
MEKAMEKLIDEDVLLLVKEQGGVRYRLWEPTFPLVVLGRSSHPSAEVFAEACAKEDIPVIKRLGGGKSVVLSPGMLVISLALETIRFRGHLFYAQAINEIIEKSLTFWGVGNINCRGISDLTLGDRKILGCCLYLTRKSDRWIVFYQASLLFDPDLSLMTRCLKHPPWEPDYRRGRPHEEFLTALRAEGHHLPIMKVASRLALALDEALPRIL